MHEHTLIGEERTGRPLGWPRVLGPFPGYDRYGRLDHYYYRCTRCGLEAVAATMRTGCPRCADAD